LARGARVPSPPFDDDCLSFGPLFFHHLPHCRGFARVHDGRARTPCSSPGSSGRGSTFDHVGCARGGRSPFMPSLLCLAWPRLDQQSQRIRCPAKFPLLPPPLRRSALSDPIVSRESGFTDIIHPQRRLS
jgi:hypothetical protein